jgi:single-strand DNA-binding protein
MGNLTKDPELRYTSSGSPVANLRMAINRIYKTLAGEKKEDVCYISVVVWGKQAENCGKYLAKGSSILVEGRLQSRNWEAPDGQKRSTIEAVALSVQFLGKPKAAGQAGSAEEPAPATAAGAETPVEPAGTEPAEGEEVPF